MLLTIFEWIIVVLVGIGGIVCTVFLFMSDYPKGGIVSLIVTIGLIVGMILGLNWYHGHTATGIRSFKDFKSELSNGINREIVITAEDGREIFRYEGKFDVERHADGDDRYLRFETQDGLRYTISYGIQDTVLIIEKEVIE